MKFILSLLAILACICQVSAQSEKPNVILIFMDDMGIGDLSCYGGTEVLTPNIDQLAAQGIRFTNCATPQATCTASRAAILTGCYPNRVGMYGALGPKDTVGLHPSETTIASMLKANGYRTAMVGKWHLGIQPEFMPTRHGFESFLGLPYSNDMWPVKPDGTPAPMGIGKGKHPPLPLLSIRAGAGNADTAQFITHLKDQGKLTSIYTAEAISLIKRYHKTPFFIYLAHSMPHVPIMPSEEFKGKTGKGLYADVITEIDASVGRIMTTLRDLNIDNNTIVVFASDNGPWLNFGNHGGSAGGLRQGKGTSWEGGTRVPAIIRWPAKIASSKVSNAFVSTIDILPTLATATGSSLPGLPVDGRDMYRLIMDSDSSFDQRPFYYYYKRNDLEAVRRGKWKLILPHEYRSYEGVLPGNDGLPGPYANGVQKELSLYNLEKDPGERYDIKAQYPGIVTELLKLADDARSDLGDDLTGQPGKGRRLHYKIVKN